MSISEGGAGRGDNIKRDWPLDRGCFLKSFFSWWACTCVGRPLWERASLPPGNPPGRRLQLAWNLRLGHHFVEVWWEKWGKVIHLLNPTPLNRRDWMNTGHLEFTEFVKLFFKVDGFRASLNVFCQVPVHWCLLRAVHFEYFRFVYPEMIKILYVWDLWSPERSCGFLKISICSLMQLTEVGNPTNYKEAQIHPLPLFLATEKLGV